MRGSPWTLLEVALLATSATAQDPPWRDPDWIVSDAGHSWAYLGHSVASAGDVNGDGIDEVIVGIPFYDGSALDRCGRVHVYLGSLNGPDLTVDWHVDGDQSDASLGKSVATAGDVDGDGYDDVIVGGDGRAWVFLGASNGLAATATWSGLGDPGSGFGWTVAGAGDVDADGFDDVLIGAYAYDGGQLYEGRAYLYLGTATGLETSPAWMAEGDSEWANFGSSLASAGDVDADGYDDVIIGAPHFDTTLPGEGRAFVYNGSPSGLPAAASWTSDGDGGQHGWCVAGAGDVDRDGYSDVFVSEKWNYFDGYGSHNDGRVLLYRGSIAGLAAVPEWRAGSTSYDDYFGVSIAGGGDVNADDCGDVLVGAPENQPEGGSAHGFFGRGSLGARECVASDNSTGDRAEISTGCSASAAGGRFCLYAGPVPDKPGIFFHGACSAQL